MILVVPQVFGEFLYVSIRIHPVVRYRCVGSHRVKQYEAN